MSEPADSKSNDAALRCPRCAVPLIETRAGENVVGGCEICGGVWLDHETLARLGRSANDAKVLASRVAIRGRARVLRPSGSVACPVCSTPLSRARVQGTDVDVDYCAAHGSWLDWGETIPFILPDADDPPRDFTVDELEAAGVTDAPKVGFFGKLARIVSRR
jgi:Zn-finger nucleic acid-binding protein